MSQSTVRAIEDRVYFARDIKPEVNACLQQAVACANDFERARSLLHQAKDMDPDQLEVYTALYKFYFYRGYLDEAELVTVESLARAAQQGGFSRDFEQLTPACTDWQAQGGPARAFLYSLKALSFIRLRKDDRAGAMAVLDKLQELDPEDQVGGSVILELAEAT
jgi:tetratricopeptide (TPR) repeat protein